MYSLTTRGKVTYRRSEDSAVMSAEPEGRSKQSHYDEKMKVSRVRVPIPGNGWVDIRTKLKVQHRVPRVSRVHVEKVKRPLKLLVQTPTTKMQCHVVKHKFSEFTKSVSTKRLAVAVISFLLLGEVTAMEANHNAKVGGQDAAPPEAARAQPAGNRTELIRLHMFSLQYESLVPLLKFPEKLPSISLTHYKNQWLWNLKRRRQLKDIKVALTMAAKLFPHPENDATQSEKVRLVSDFICLVNSFLHAVIKEAKIQKLKGNFNDVVWKSYVDVLNVLYRYYARVKRKLKRVPNELDLLTKELVSTDQPPLYKQFTPDENELPSL